MSGSSPAVVAQAEEACSTMQAALAALKDSTDASCPRPSRQQIEAAVHLLRMETAKMGLVYNVDSAAAAGAEADVVDADATALLQGMQRAACTLCMLYTGLAVAGGGGGPTLRRSLHQTATAVVEACVALIGGAVVDGVRDAQLMMLSGFCLQMLEAAGKAPLDNRTAIGRALTQALKQLVDAHKEMGQAVQQAAEAANDDGVMLGQGLGQGQAAAGGGDGGMLGQGQGLGQAAAGGGEEEVEEDDDDVGGFGFEQDAFGPGELAVARGVQVREGGREGTACLPDCTPGATAAAHPHTFSVIRTCCSPCWAARWRWARPLCRRCWRRGALERWGLAA